MTAVVATTVGLEVWGAVASKAVATQVGMEVWGAVNSTEAVTQIGKEVWASPDTVSLLVATQAGLEVWASSGQLVFSSSALWQSDVIPNSQSTYVEGANQMSWSFTTVRLPTLESMRENLVIESNLMMAFIGAGPVVSILMQDTNGAQIQALNIQPSGAPTLWDQFNWDQAPWDGTLANISPYQLAWTQPLTFKQASFAASGLSSVGFRIGTLYMMGQQQGYQQALPSGVK